MPGRRPVAESAVAQVLLTDSSHTPVLVRLHPRDDFPLVSLEY